MDRFHYICYITNDALISRQIIRYFQPGKPKEAFIMDRVYNFAAGPAALPLPVLETAQKEMLAYGSTGMSVMEMSHRSKMYLEIFERAQSAFRRVMNVPDNYKVLFLQGGATGQFAAVPMNLLKTEADYADTGNFAHGAMVEAQKYGKVNCIASSRDDGYTFIPDITPDMVSENADYVHKIGRASWRERV